ncbi:MAG: hypothetical protein ACLSE4_11885 [Clostridium sp.]
MKKNMALVMATMMAAASLTACGGSGTASTTAADTKAADTTAADSAADTKAAPADKIGLAGSGKELIFTTGGDQGTYYGFGSVIAGQDERTDTTVTAIVGKAPRATSRLWTQVTHSLVSYSPDVMSTHYTAQTFLISLRFRRFPPCGSTLHGEQVQT